MAARSNTKPIFFATTRELRAWFDAHHTTADELIAGYHKKHTGRPSITWSESVDEALCVGWIDGIRRSLGDASYQIRFTPRKLRSIWSAINIAKAEALVKEKRMRPMGHKAFAAREENRSGIYAYEQRPAELPEPYASRFKKNKAAWKFFQSTTPGYRRLMTWRIVSAKREETRLQRLAQLMELCTGGELHPGTYKYKKPRKALRRG